MDLILWRHAQAQPAPMRAPDAVRASTEVDGLGSVLVTEAAEPDALVATAAPFDLATDLIRPLTPKGERQAERMAEWLNQRLGEGTRVLVSPARRTQQTAQALGRHMKTVPSLNPLASVDDVLAAARWPASRDPVLIVGHQPTLGLLAAHLMTGKAQPWSIRKGAVWWLRGRERDGVFQVALHAIQNPDLL